MPVSALAETTTAPEPAGTQTRNWPTSTNGGGYFIDLPAANAKQLIVQIRTYRASLTQQEEEITQYIDENQLDVTDTLISVIMPGGLLYAAIRKGNLEEAKSELTRITADMNELSRDLLAMQVMAGELTVAQLKQ